MVGRTTVATKSVASRSGTRLSITRRLPSRPNLHGYYFMDYCRRTEAKHVEDLSDTASGL